MRLKSFTKLLVVFAVCLVPVLAFAEEAVKITDILVEGSKKIEAETIRSKMTVKPGDAFSPSRIRSDVSAIYKMGYFDDVKVEAEGYAGGIRLTIVVTERPILTSYSFEGNKELDSQKLREKVNLTAYSVYNPTLVQENVQKLKIFYQDEGYYNAEITPIIKRTSPKEIKVIFAIKEGDRVVISKVLFTGNDKISSRKLRKVMETKEHTFIWSWLTKSGTYKLNEFNQDMERIRGLYYNNGYLNVKIDEPVIILDDKKKGLTITIPVHEGDQFRLRDIKVVGNKIFSEKELIDSIASKPGQIMNRDQIRTDIITLTDLYGSKGYAFASISPIINTDNEKKAADITMDVSEGDKIFVSRINISGNVKTRDKVIRRELKFNEGEIYDTTSLKRSYERLHALEYFEDMEITPQRRTDNPDKVDLAVTVKEKSTGSFSIGGGYSTIDSLVGLGEVTQNNFLGRGQQLRVKGEIGSKRQNYVVSFTEPWLMDKPISLRVDLYKEERDYSGYKKRSTGGGLTLGKRFWEYYGINGSYNYSDERYFDVLTDIKEAFGDTLKLHTTS
ncbi:MAG TPA: outer membrane protein assembly factor BamA, partial [Nitrospirota bacterium]